MSFKPSSHSYGKKTKAESTTKQLKESNLSYQTQCHHKTFFCFNQQKPLYNNGNEKASSGTQASSQQTMTNDSAVAKQYSG